ncbi:MAG: hypothetical protein J5809_06780 [Selenomonadaceae bacterium]|nr:hypothetical protein [Selenomonadaceae bacterium]
MREKFLTAAVALIIFAVMFALNDLMPLHRDDYDYSLIWGTAAHINSLSDVFESTWQHYFLHGGRLVTVFWLNLFLWLGKFPFDAANALMFVALVILIYVHARRALKFDEPWILAAAGLLTWLCLPHFGEVAVWKSGSTVYLWSAVPVALFLLPFNLALAGRKFSGKFFVVGMFALGILAGCSVENLAVTVTLFSLAAAVRLKVPWMAAGALGNLIGLVALLAAPGNFVRYDAQGAGKGILSHIGNQIAGNAEMLIFLLPVILLMFCALGILRNTTPKPPRVSKVLVGAIGIFVVSYFGGNLISGAIRDFCAGVIFPELNPSVKFVERFDNFMAKSEEFVIYALILAAIFLPLKNSLGVAKVNLREALKFEPVRYAAALLALALFNNLVMIGAPTFPARATFSSVVMILIGAVAILRIPAVTEKFSRSVILKAGALLIGGFTIISALVITKNLRAENDVRISAVQRAAAENMDEVSFKPIEIKNRALRHVFYVDFDNSVTTGGLCKFYGIKKISVEE